MLTSIVGQGIECRGKSDSFIIPMESLLVFARFVYTVARYEKSGMFKPLGSKYGVIKAYRTEISFNFRGGILFTIDANHLHCQMRKMVLDTIDVRYRCFIDMLTLPYSTMSSLPDSLLHSINRIFSDVGKVPAKLKNYALPNRFIGKHRKTCKLLHTLNRYGQVSNQMKEWPLRIDVYITTMPWILMAVFYASMFHAPCFHDSSGNVQTFTYP